MKCPKCGHEFEGQQNRAAKSRWSSMTPEQKSAEMSRIRRKGIKKPKRAVRRANNKLRHGATMAEAREKLKITAHYTPHGLRHATAQFWEQNNVPHSEISRLLGHKDLKTTQRYLQSGRAGVPKNLPTPI